MSSSQSSVRRIEACLGGPACAITSRLCSIQSEAHYEVMFRLFVCFRSHDIRGTGSYTELANAMEHNVGTHGEQSIAAQIHLSRYSHAMLQCEAVAESAETRLELVEQKLPDCIQDISRHV